MNIIGEVTMLGRPCTVVEYIDGRQSIPLFCTSIIEKKNKKGVVKETVLEHIEPGTYVNTFKHFIKTKYGSDKVVPEEIVAELIELSQFLDRHDGYYKFNLEVHVDETMIYLSNPKQQYRYGDLYNGGEKIPKIYAHKVKGEYVFTNGTAKKSRHYKLMKRLMA